MRAAGVPLRVGILAGGGGLPREIAESVLSRGGQVLVVAIEEEVDQRFDGLPHVFVRWGQVGKISAEMRRAGCTEMLIAGKARRPDLRRMKPDLGFFLALSAVLRSIASGGDDALLRGVVRHFERQGFRVIGPAEAAPELLVGPGPLGRFAPRPNDDADIAAGFDIIRCLGPFDIGQGAVVADGRVLAIEGAEGTDAMLARVAAMRKARAVTERIGVLVKSPKPGQELRVDLPAIGPETVTRAEAAGLSGIAVVAGQTIGIERREIMARADGVSLFVYGAERAASNEVKFADGLHKTLARVRTLGRVGLRARDRADALLGAAVACALKPWDAGVCVVAVRGHVLAVEASEGAASTIERTGALRQWGRRKRRAGAAVLAGSRDIEPAAIAAAAAAGLAGFAMDGAEPSHDVVDAAARSGMFVASVSMNQAEPE